jgi:hypothetical protein
MRTLIVIAPSARTAVSMIIVVTALGPSASGYSERLSPAPRAF